jgi:hypothetical protein
MSHLTFHPDRENPDSLPARRLNNSVRVDEEKKQRRTFVRRFGIGTASSSRPSGLYWNHHSISSNSSSKAARPRLHFELIQPQLLKNFV